MKSQNILGAQHQEAEFKGDVPFEDLTAPVTTGNEIVSFSTVESPTLETVPMPTEVDPNTLTVMEEGRDHSIKDILGREYYFEDFVIIPGGLPGEILKSWDVLSIFLAQPNVADKVAGFAYLRCHLVIRLEFTTLPVVSGGVMLSYFPDLTAGALSNRTGNILQLSQVPNVQQSLTTAISMKIDVPWISPLYARDLVNNNGSMGTVILSRLTPSSTANVAVKAYISAAPDSIHLQYPVPLDPATAMVQKKNKLRVLIGELEEMGEDMSGYPELQSETRAISNNGAVSGILGMGANIANAVSGIPFVGSVASTLAPLLGIGSNLAAAFGFSKPLEDKPVVAFKFKPGDAHLTNEGVLPSHQFTVNQACGVVSDYGPFGSKVDEMSTEAVMRTPNIIDNMTISSSYAARTVLFQKNLNLMQFQQSSLTSLYLTHQAWMSGTCSLWNATLNFDFDVYLTHFHRVKIRFVVLPNVYLPVSYVGSLLPASIDINKASSAVVEFSGDNTNWSIQVAPRSITAMKRSPNARPLTAAATPSVPDLITSSNTFDTSYGTIIAMIEVPLQASTTVSPIVYGVSSFSAENVELSGVLSIPAFAPEFQSKISTLGTSYAKLSRSERMTRGADGLISNSVPVDSRANLLRCAGDSVIHWRNLTNAFTKFNNMRVDSGVNGRTILFYPTIRRDVVNSMITDLIDYMSVGYGFYKGSLNVRVIPVPIGDGNDIPLRGVIGTAMLLDSNARETVYTTTSLMSGVFSATQNTAISGTRSIPIYGAEGVLDFSVPFYQNIHIVQNSNLVSGGGPGVIKPKALALTTYNRQAYEFYRATGEDFRAGFLMSLPLFRVSQRPLATFGA